MPFEFGSDAPAGALSAPAPDMAQFMMAHLNGGVLPGGDESNRILKPETTELMHSVANRPGPGVDAMAHGFYEQQRNGVRAIAHGGDLTAFHSELVLIPSAKVGLFVSFNSSGKDNSVYKLRTALYEAFMDRYFPRQAQPNDAPPADPKEHAAAVAGPYEASRRAEKSLFSFFYMFGQSAATANDDGTIEVGGLTGLNDEPKKFREVEPWLWREVDGEMRLAATHDDQGNVVSLVPDGYGPIIVFQRATGVARQAMVAAGGHGRRCSRGAGSAHPRDRSLRRRFARSAAATPAPVADRNRRRSLIASLLCFAFIALAVSVLLMFSSQSFWVISSDARWFVRLLQLSALAAVIGSVVAVIAAVDTWRAPTRKLSLSIGRTVAGGCLPGLGVRGSRLPLPVGPAAVLAAILCGMKSKQATLGTLLRKLRARNDWTLKQMSERTGIPVSTLSKVEHDRLTLTYDKLQQLSQRLNIRMSELFAEGDIVPDAPVTARRSVGRVDRAIRVNTKNYDYYYLCPELRRKRMIPVLTRIRARSVAEFGELVHHSGEEYIYVIEGRVEIHTEFYDPIVLEAGESIYIDSNMGHAYVAAEGCNEATVIGVCSSADDGLMQSLMSLHADEPVAVTVDDTEAAKPERPTRSEATEGQDNGHTIMISGTPSSMISSDSGAPSRA